MIYGLNAFSKCWRSAALRHFFNFKADATSSRWCDPHLGSRSWLTRETTAGMRDAGTSPGDHIATHLGL